jgi:hypothetical protein
MKIHLFAAAVVLAVAQLTGCAVAPAEDEGPVVVTAESVEALPAGQKLDLSLEADEAYTFDGTRAAIDFAHVDLVTPERRIAMTDVLTAVAAQKSVTVQSLVESTFTISRHPEELPPTVVLCWFVMNYYNAQGERTTVRVPIPCDT